MVSLWLWSPLVVPSRVASGFSLALLVFGGGVGSEDAAVLPQAREAGWIVSRRYVVSAAERRPWGFDPEPLGEAGPTLVCDGWSWTD